MLPNLSYFMFNLLYKSVKHKTSDNSYLITTEVIEIQVEEPQGDGTQNLKVY